MQRSMFVCKTTKFQQASNNTRQKETSYSAGRGNPSRFSSFMVGSDEVPRSIRAIWSSAVIEAVLFWNPLLVLRPCGLVSTKSGDAEKEKTSLFQFSDTVFRPQLIWQKDVLSTLAARHSRSLDGFIARYCFHCWKHFRCSGSFSSGML